MNEEFNDNATNIKEAVSIVGGVVGFFKGTGATAVAAAPIAAIPIVGPLLYMGAIVVGGAAGCAVGAAVPSVAFGAHVPKP